MRRLSIATILVGPSALLREGLARILAAADFRVASSLSRVEDLAPSSSPAQRPILLIIDAGGDLDAAVRQIELFKQWYPNGRIAVLADHNERSDIISAFRAGANAYFVKVAPCDAFIKSLELIMLGETILPAAMLSMIYDHADDDDHHEPNAIVCDAPEPAEPVMEAQNSNVPQLSARERCILGFLIDGASNKAIARRINIAEATVKVHVKAILRKIRVHNRTQAAIWGMSHGLPIATADDGAPAADKQVVRLPIASHLMRALPVAQPNGAALAPVINEPIGAVPPAVLPSNVEPVRIGMRQRRH